MCENCHDGVPPTGAAAHRCCGCADAGFVRYARPLDHPRFGKAELCPDCHGQKAYENPPEDDPEKRARIPVRFRGVTFLDWLPETGRERQSCEAYVESWPPAKPALLLMGLKGTGKTTLACAVMRAAAMRHGVAAQFWPVIDLLDRYRATFDEDRATETVAQIDAHLAKFDLLVLDDWGTHKGTDWAGERLFRLVDERYRDSRPLIITTNVTLQEMDGRVKSRMSDVKVSQMVNFAGRDMREVTA